MFNDTLETLPGAYAPVRPVVAAKPLHARPIEERDLDGVARLFLSRFRRGREASSDAARIEVASYMRDLYFNSPCAKDGALSLVRPGANGEVTAFIGIVPTKYRLDGEELTAGMNGALMAAPGLDHSLAVVQLLRDVNRLPLDLVFTDTANRASLAIGQAMKYKVLSPQSLEWANVFDPAALALHKLKQKIAMTPTPLLRPFARLADIIFQRATRDRLKTSGPVGWSDVEVDAATFVDIAPRFLTDFRLRPDWSESELSWLCAQAAKRDSAGPLHLRVVRDGRGGTIGCYAFYGERGGVARVLHSGSRSGDASGLLARMLATAREMGCIGAHGPAREGMMGHIHATPGMFLYYAGGTMAISRRQDVLDAIDGGDAFIGGFAGDRWTRLGTDKFGRR